MIAYVKSRRMGSKHFINDVRPNWNHQSQEVGIPAVKIRMVLRLLAEDGWVLVAARRSPRQFEHPVKRGRVTVAGKDSADLAPGTYNSSLSQAKLKGPEDALCRGDRESGRGIFGLVPDLPGCGAAGETVAKVRAMLESAIPFHIEGLKAGGADLPPPESAVEWVEL